MKAGKKVPSLIWWTSEPLCRADKHADHKREWRVLGLWLVMLSLITACSNNTDEVLYFTGSSLIEKWDVRRYFPTKQTYNLGLSGSGIAYVESQGNRFRNEDVVLIIGGNDVLVVNDVDKYVQRYVQMLQSMEAKRIYLFSILPRLAFETDGYEKVCLLNAKIKQEVSEQVKEVVYIDVFGFFLRDGKLNQQFFYDGTHLNEWGYDLISEELKKVLL